MVTEEKMIKKFQRGAIFLKIVASQTKKRYNRPIFQRIEDPDYALPLLRFF